MHCQVRATARLTAFRSQHNCYRPKKITSISLFLFQWRVQPCISKCASRNGQMFYSATVIVALLVIYHISDEVSQEGHSISTVW